MSKKTDTKTRERKPPAKTNGKPKTGTAKVKPVKVDPKTSGKLETFNGKVSYPPYVKIRHSQATHERIKKAAAKRKISITEFCADAVAQALKGTR